MVIAAVVSGKMVAIKGMIKAVVVSGKMVAIKGDGYSCSGEWENGSHQRRWL
jgi:uncharacterized Zn-binding protein involved in type VI secretion